MRAIVCILLFGAAGLLATPPAATAGPREDENKRIAQEFYELAINRKDFAAAEKFLGPRYIQHNQRARDGKEGLKAFLQFLRERYPRSHSEIRKAFVDGDYVILHVHAVREPGTRGTAIVDIFRLEDSRIVEHWDVHEDIIGDPANANGMF